MFYHYLNRFVTAASKVAYATVIGRHMHMLSSMQTDQAYNAALKLVKLPYGSQGWRNQMDVVRNMVAEQGIPKELEGKAISYACLSGAFGHFYHLVKALIHPGLDSQKAMKDPLLMAHYILGITGCRGVLLPDLHADLIERLKNANNEEYAELLETTEFKDALQKGSEELKKRCANGELVQDGTVAVLHTDAVESRGHTIADEVNSLVFQTVRHHHSLDQGFSIHQFILIAGKLYFQNIGLGKSAVPGGDQLNNIIAAMMWSVSPLAGFMCYIADTLGVEHVEEWLVKENIRDAITAVDLLRTLGSNFGRLNHWAVDKARFNAYNDPILEQRALQRSYNHEGMTESITLLEDVITPQQGEELAKRMVGITETDPRMYYELAPGKSNTLKDPRQPGIYDQYRLLGALDYMMGTGVAGYNPSYTNPEWIKTLDKIIMELIPTYMTPQTLVSFREEYQEKVQAFIENLEPDVRAQPQLVKDAVQTSVKVRIFAESYLEVLRDKMIASVADKFMQIQKVKPTQTAVAFIMTLISERYSATVQDYYFAEEGFVATWNDRAVLQYTISQVAEELLKQRRDLLLQEKAAHEKSFEEHKRKHTEEDRKNDAKLEKEYEDLKRNFENATKSYEDAQNDVDFVEDMKAHAGEHGKKFDDKDKALENGFGKSKK